MTWTFNKVNLVCGLIALLGIAQFIYAVPQAMSVYPGGYSIAHNFLSDLGCTVTSSYLDNSASASIFNRSIIVLGFSLIPFFVVLPTVLGDAHWIIRCSGVLSAMGLIGIGSTPYDRYFVEHFVALGLWITPMLIVVVTFAFSIELGGIASLSLSVCTFLVVSAAGAYALAGSHSGHVIFQKALAILSMFWFFLVFVIVSVSTIQSIPSTRQIAERQAREYLNIIKSNHRRRKVIRSRSRIEP
jgi:hypothetical protein